ncbi:OmpP1/FadL family transporter [Ketobacter sp.]|uniref:OmpP1/FadL family transporter n=1 Tax=Ketobacter sp. TaxID=2083498 RepID=UPI0025C56715|nr:outer membrane protein transport protein [Ketobacter sp.]
MLAFNPKPRLAPVQVYALAWGVGIALVLQSTPTRASFTDSITIGNPKALSLGHAVTADPPDIDSIHFNPAGLSRLKGRQMFIKGIVGLFSTEMELGGYGDYMSDMIDDYREQHRAFEDENGDLLYGRSPWDEYVYNETLFTKSRSEGGPTLMLPGGMVDMPIGAGMAGGATYNPPGSRFTFGTNVYAPMMNGMHVAKDDPGRFAQERAAFTLITYFSPTVAYEVSDELSVGLSINFNYSGMGLELPIHEPHVAIFFLGSPFIQGTFCNSDGTPKQVGDNNLGLNPEWVVDVCTEVPPFTTFGKLSFEVDQNLVLGYNLGLLWQPKPWLTLGLSYNSAIDVEMDGEFAFPIYDPFKTFLYNFHSSDVLEAVGSLIGNFGLQLPTAEEIQNDAEGPLTVSYEIPQRWNAGLSIQLTPKWKWNIDARWTEWSAFSQIYLEFGMDVPLLKWGNIADLVGTGEKNGITPNSVDYQISLRDVAYWGTGVEYQYNEHLVIRAGFEDRPSAVPEDAPNALIPLNDSKLISFGFGLDLEEDRHIDFAIGHLKSKTDFPACSAQLGNGCDPANVVYPSYAGQDIKTKVEVLLFEIGFQQHF